MEKKRSFTGLEKQYLHEFRKRVNLTEDLNDLNKLFNLMVGKIIQSESLRNMNIKGHDIAFDPQREEGYHFSERLMQTREFREVYDHSDLRNVIGRFAQPMTKRFVHLKRNPKRSDTKIRE